MSKSDPAEQAIRDIRRKTRKRYSAEEKIRIVLSGLRGEESIAALCRHEGIAEGLYYSWSKEFLEAGKKRLAGDTARQASSPEVKTLRVEARDLKEALAEQILENRLLKKSMIGDGGDEEWDIPHLRNWKSSGWSKALIYRSGGRWISWASRARRFTGGTTGIEVEAALMTAPVAPVGCGTASPTMCASRSWRWPWMSRNYRPGNWP